MAGSWPLLSKQQRSRLNAAFMKPLRAVAGVHRPPAAEEYRVSNLAVLRHLAVAPLEWELVCARLRLAARLAARAPDYTTALLQGPGGTPWRLALVESLAAMHKMLPDKLASLPAPAVDPAAWEAVWRRCPAGGAALVRLLHLRVRQDPAAALVVMRAAPLLSHHADELDEEDPDEFLCGHCPRTFATFAGAQTHRARAHNLTGADCIRRSVIGSACPACNVDFRSRVRVISHLRLRQDAVGACRAAVLTGRFANFTEEQVQAADEADLVHRRACRRTGRHPAHGPPCIP
jgi:hypothetical protein